MHAAVLKYFIEVARCGSVRKASERLYVAASAINRQIHKLEDELGVELFDRLPHGLRINPAGERLLRHAQETLHDFGLMRSELDRLKGEKTGHIKVAAVDSCLEDLLPSAVEEFLQVFPAVTYTVTATQATEVAPAVLCGLADMGITFVGRLPPGVVAMALADLPLGVVMAPGHPLAEFQTISLAQCAQYPFLRSGTRPVLSSGQSPEFTAFWEQLEPAATSNSTRVLKRLVVAGKGISCFTKIGFMQEIARGDIVWRPFELQALNALQIGLIVSSQRSLPHTAQNFAGRLARRLAELEKQAAALG